MGKPTFYFTCHPGDMGRARLPEGCSVMLVASAHWDSDRRRFRIRRPPAEHIASLCVDGGGFTAARRWGTYPWSPEQYADFIRAVARDVPLDFCAVLDYACERGVDRSVLATNRERIEVGLENERACREAAPDLPWLPVLQGDSLEERAYDLALRRREDLVPAEYAGVGSVCGRGAKGAREAITWLRGQLPRVQFHGFGLHVHALRDPVVYDALRSWDSYSWTWPAAPKKERPPTLRRGEGETWSRYTSRIAEAYLHGTVERHRCPPSPQVTLL